MDKLSTSLNFGESEEEIKRKLVKHYGTPSSYYSSPSASSRDTATLKTNELLFTREDQLVMLDRLKRSPMVKASLALLRTSAVDWKDQAIVLAQSLNSFKIDYIDEWNKTNGANTGTDIESQKDHMLLLLQPVVKEAEAAITIWRESIWKYDDRIGVSTENNTTSSSLTPDTKTAYMTTPTDKSSNSNSNTEIAKLRHQLDQSQLRVRNLEQEVKDCRSDYNRVNSELTTTKNALHSSTSSSSSTTASTTSSTKSIVEQWLDCKKECSKLQARVKELENSEKILKSEIKSLESQLPSSADSQDNQSNSKLISSPSSNVFTPIKPSYSPLTSKSRQDLESLIERLTFENDTLNQDIRTSKSALDSVQRKAENLERSSRETQQLLDQERLRYLQLANSDSPGGRESQPVDDTLSLHRELQSIKQQLADQMSKYDTDTKALKTEILTLQHSLSTTESDKQNQVEENESIRKEVQQLKSLQSNYQREIQQVQIDAQSQMQAFQKEKSELQSEIHSLKCVLEEYQPHIGATDKQQRGGTSSSGSGSGNARSATGGPGTPNRGSSTGGYDTGIGETENRLRSDLRRAEFSNRELSENNIKYEGEISKLRQELLTLRRSESEARSELQSACDQQMHGLQVEVRKLQGLLREEQFNASHQIGELEEQLLNLQNERIIVQRDLLSLRSELELALGRINTLERELAAKSQQYDQQRKQWELDRNEVEARLTAASDSESRLRGEVSRLERLNAELNERFASSDGEYSRLRLDLAAMRRGEGEARAALQSSFDLQTAALQSEIKKLQAQLIEEQGRAAQTVGELEGQLLNLQNERIIVQRDLLSLRSELELSLGRINTLERELAAKSQQYEQYRKQWESGRNGLESQLSGLSETEKRLRQDNRRQESLISELAEKSKRCESDACKYRQELINLRKSEAEEKSELQLTFERQTAALQSEIKKLQTQLIEEQGRSGQSVGELEGQLLNLQNERIIVQRDLLSLRSELELSLGRINTLERELAAKSQQYEQQRKQWELDRNEVEARLTAASDAESRLRSELRRCEQIILDLNEKNNEKDSNLKDQSRFLARLKEEVQVASSSVQDLESRLEAANTDNYTLQRNLASTRSELELMASRVASLEYDIEIRIQQYDQLKKQFEAVKSSLESQVGELSAAESRYSQECRKLEAKRNELLEVIRRLEEEVARGRQELQQCKKSESDSRGQMQGEYEAQIQSLQMECKRLQGLLNEENQRASQRTADFEGYIEELENEKETAQKDLSSLRAELELSRKQLEALGRELKDYETSKKRWDSHRVALEDQIAALTETETRLKADVKRLEQSNVDLTRGNELLEIDVKNLTKTISRQKEDISAAVQAGQILESRIDTLQTEKVSLQSSLLGLGNEVELYRNRSESLEQDLSQRLVEHDRQKKLLESSRYALEAQITLLNESENSVKTELRRAEQSIVDLTQKNSDLEQAFSSHMASCKQADKYASDNLRSVNDTLHQQRQLQEEIQQQIAKIDSLRNNLRITNQLKEELEHQAASMQSKWTSSQIEIQALRSELDLCRSRNETLEQDLQQRNQEHDQRRRRSDSSRLALEAQVNSLTESESRLKSELRRSEQAVNDMTETLRGYEGDLVKLRQEISTLKKTESQARAEVNASFEQQLSSLQGEVRRLQSQLKDEQSKGIQSLRELESRNHTLQNERLLLLRETSSLKSEAGSLREKLDYSEQALAANQSSLGRERQKLLDANRGSFESQLVAVSESEGSLRREVSQLRGYIAELEESNRRLEAELEALQSDHKVMRTAHDRAVEDLRKRLYDGQNDILQRQREMQNEEMIAATQNTLELESLIEKLTTENQTLMKSLTAARSEIELTSVRARKFENEYTQMVQQYDVQRKRLESSVMSLTDTENSLRNDLRHKEQMEIEKTSEISKLKTQLRHLQTAPSPAESLLAEHRSKWDDQRQSLQREVQRQVALTMSLKEEIETLHRQRSDLQDQLDRVRGELSSKVSSSTAEAAAKQKHIDTLESEKESLHRALTEAEFQIDSLNKAIGIHKENASKLGDSATTSTRLLQLDGQVRELSASLSASNQRHKEDLSQARQTERILRDSLQRAEQEKLALELQFSKYKLPRESPVKSSSSASDLTLSYSSPSSTTPSETSSRTINNLQSELTKCKAELNEANYKLVTLTQTCQLLREELATTKRRTDLLNDQKIQMTREYEEQIQRLESELKEAKHSEAEGGTDLQAAWESQRTGLERDLKNAQALIQVLQDEHTTFAKTKADNEARIQSLQTEIEKLKTTNRSSNSSSNSSHNKSYSFTSRDNSGSSGGTGTGNGGFVSSRALLFSNKK